MHPRIITRFENIREHELTQFQRMVFLICKGLATNIIREKPIEVEVFKSLDHGMVLLKVVGIRSTLFKREMDKCFGWLKPTLQYIDNDGMGDYGFTLVLQNFEIETERKTVFTVSLTQKK